MATKTKTANAARNDAAHAAPSVSLADYIVGGFAVLEVGEHTFRVSSTDDRRTGGKVRFLSVHDGKGRDGYSYIGLIQQDGSVKLTQKSRYNADSAEYAEGAAAIANILADADIPKGMTVTLRY